MAWAIEATGVSACAYMDMQMAVPDTENTKAARYGTDLITMCPPRARLGAYKLKWDSSQAISKVLGRIRIILLALDAGFTVKETKTFLSGYPVTTTPAERWRALASKKLTELDEQMERLTQMKSILNDSFQCACLRVEECEERMPPTQRIS